jgi:hypothetical protein
MYYEWYQKNRKLIIGGIIFIILLLTAWGIWVYVSRQGKVPVTISAVPRDSSVMINGQPSGNGTTWLVPGSYIVEAKKDGFESRKKTITVTDGKEQNVVALGLTPVSDEAQKWAEKNASAYKDNETYGALEAQANGQYFQEKNPIVAHLPYDDPYFQITYTANTNNEAVLTITTPSPRYRYFAIQKIRELGYDPSDFKIQFSDFKNPLEK